MLESSWFLAFRLLPIAFWQTLYMTLVSGAISLLIGLPLGILLFVTRKGGFYEKNKTHKILSGIVNVGRSFPFAILIIALIPFTRLIVGTSLGTTAAIVPLSIAAAPYIARVVEAAFLGVDKGLIEAATVIGSTPYEIVKKVLLPETLPSLILQTTVTLVNLVGYTAMAGLVGGGGLGAIAVQYGYQRFDGLIMFCTVLLLILLVQMIQWVGNYWANGLYRRRGLS